MPRLKEKKAKKPAKEYQQQLVSCDCQRCWDETGGRTRRLPKYTRRKHAIQFPRLDVNAKANNYLAVPFGPSERLPRQQEPNPAQGLEFGAGSLNGLEPILGGGEAAARSAGTDMEEVVGVDGAIGMEDRVMNEEDVSFPDLHDLHDFQDYDTVDIGDANLDLSDEDFEHQDIPQESVVLVATADILAPPALLSLSDSIPAVYANPTHRYTPPDDSEDAQDTVNNADSTPFWRIVLLAITWLHLTYHVPHRACNLLLRLFRLAAQPYSIFPPGSKPVVTLTSAFRRLDLADRFLVLPMCPTCRFIVPQDTPRDSVCPNCSKDLFTLSGLSRLIGEYDDYDTINDEDSKIILKFPFNPISRQLPCLLKQPGIEKKLEEWRTRQRDDGELHDIMDGKIWKTLPGPDGTPFFDNDPDRGSNEELRIAVTLGIDGFGYHSTKFAGTYSTEAISCCVANLPIQFRYLTRNLLLVGVYPGPSTPDNEQSQYFLELFVDDLIRLFEEGVWVKTHDYPEGRLVRLVLIAVCCDHPAMCRVAGFADHGHTNCFCTKCKVKQVDLKTQNGLKNGFVVRTGDEHRMLAFKYRAATLEEKTKLFQEHGVRYTELARLRYFDSIRMTVIDPMHNILLGIMKSQWHDSWIKTDVLRERTDTNQVLRELDLLNAYLKEFEMPSWVGRLPSKVGYPAAGNLSADEYKALALVYLPIIIPFVWSEWQPVAEEEYKKKLDKWKKKERAKERRLQLGTSVKDGDDTSSPEPVIRMHPDDSDNFLKLAAALKIILARSIRVADLARAENLLGQFLQAYLKIHPDDIKPNFHYVTHVFDQIRDYGPVYGFWSFTYERMNKTLKSYNTNNAGGGEVKTTFMRAFTRDAKLRELVRSAADPITGEVHREVQKAAELMLQSDSDDRGTVAAMARELDEAAADLGKRFSLGTGSAECLSDSLQSLLVSFYKEQHPDANVRARNSKLGKARLSEVNFLDDSAIFRKYIILDGRRIAPSTRLFKAPNSIVQARFGAKVYVGQVTDIFTHTQQRIDAPTTFIRVQWFEPLEPEVLNSAIWDTYPELEVRLFKFNKFLDRSKNGGPPSLISPNDILSQASRVRVEFRPPRRNDTDRRPDPIEIWVTIGLTKDTVSLS